jgi:hypothetical protein
LEGIWQDRYKQTASLLGPVILVLILHLLLPLLRLHDQPLFLPDPGLAAHVKGNDGSYNEDELDDRPHLHECLESFISDPVEQSDHDAQHAADGQNHDSSISENLTATQWVKVFGNALEFRLESPKFLRILELRHFQVNLAVRHLV